MSARLWTATVHVGAQLRINVHMGNNGTFTLLTQANSPHPLLLWLQWDACGFSLRREKHFDVQRGRGEGAGRARRREFNSNAPLFALNKSLKLCHKRRVSTADYSSGGGAGG